MTRFSKNRFFDLFTPKLVSVLQEGYGIEKFRADAIAGLTVAIVALPLSMAIAIASGATPAQGLYTAIIGGFLVSLLGGSRFQIGGPAGAFIVLVAATVMQHGMDGLVLATLLSGILLSLAGFLKLGSFIKFIPFPVTIGFTVGIAIIIFSSQITDIFGLQIEDEPGKLQDLLPALWKVRNSFTPAALAISAGTALLIFLIRHRFPRLPAMLLAIIIATTAAVIFKFPITTIGSEFGGIPATLPAPKMPGFSFTKIVSVLPAALSFTLLGAIESLLSAVVADGMTGRRHRSNCELVAQGVANIGSAMFGGFCVTGTIARTATNIRSRAYSPISGIMHSVFLLLFMLIAAPLAAYIPLAALAGVLVVVAWDMIDYQAIRILFQSGWGEAIILLSTLALTVSFGLIEGILAGLILGSLLFIKRMSEATKVVTDRPFVISDKPDYVDPRHRYDAQSADESGIAVYRISGALFFGAAASLSSALDSISGSSKAVIIDFSSVPFLDSSGANLILGTAREAAKKNTILWLTGASIEIRRSFLTHGIKKPLVRYAGSIEDAYQEAKEELLHEKEA